MENNYFNGRVRVGTQSVPLIVQPQITIFSSREDPFENFDNKLDEILNNGNLGIVRMLQKNMNDQKVIDDEFIKKLDSLKNTTNIQKQTIQNQNILNTKQIQSRNYREMNKIQDNMKTDIKNILKEIVESKGYTPKKVGNERQMLREKRQNEIKLSLKIQNQIDTCSDNSSLSKSSKRKRRGNRTLSIERSHQSLTSNRKEKEISQNGANENKKYLTNWGQRTRINFDNDQDQFLSQKYFGLSMFKIQDLVFQINKRKEEEDVKEMVEVEFDGQNIELYNYHINIINSFNEHYKHIVEDYFKQRDKTDEYKKTIEKLRIGFYKDIIKLENYSYNLESKLQGISDLEHFEVNHIPNASDNSKSDYIKSLKIQDDVIIRQIHFFDGTEDIELNSDLRDLLNHKLKNISSEFTEKMKHLESLNKQYHLEILRYKILTEGGFTFEEMNAESLVEKLLVVCHNPRNVWDAIELRQPGYFVSVIQQEYRIGDDFSNKIVNDYRKEVAKLVMDHEKRIQELMANVKIREDAFRKQIDELKTQVKYIKLEIGPQIELLQSKISETIIEVAKKQLQQAQEEKEETVKKYQDKIRHQQHLLKSRAQVLEATNYYQDLLNEREDIKQQIEKIENDHLNKDENESESDDHNKKLSWSVLAQITLNQKDRHIQKLNEIEDAIKNYLDLQDIDKKWDIFKDLEFQNSILLQKLDQKTRNEAHSIWFAKKEYNIGQKYFLLYQQANQKIEELQQQNNYLNDELRFQKMDQQIIHQEERIRKCNEYYTQLLENELDAFNRYLGIEKFHNPAFAAIKLNPIQELKALRLKYMNNSSNFIRKVQFKAFRCCQEFAGTQTINWVANKGKSVEDLNVEPKILTYNFEQQTQLDTADKSVDTSALIQFKQVQVQTDEKSFAASADVILNSRSQSRKSEKQNHSRKGAQISNKLQNISKGRRSTVIHQSQELSTITSKKRKSEFQSTNLKQAAQLFKDNQNKQRKIKQLNQDLFSSDQKISVIEEKCSSNENKDSQSILSDGKLQDEMEQKEMKVKIIKVKRDQQQNSDYLLKDENGHFEGKSKFTLEQSTGINVTIDGQVEKYYQKKGEIEEETIVDLDQILQKDLEKFKIYKRNIDLIKKQNKDPKKQSDIKNFKPKQRVFQVRPFNIQCLENFLESKINQARRTSQGTQTIEIDDIHPIFKTIIEKEKDDQNRKTGCICAKNYLNKYGSIKINSPTSQSIQKLQSFHDYENDYKTKSRNQQRPYSTLTHNSVFKNKNNNTLRNSEKIVLQTKTINVCNSQSNLQGQQSQYQSYMTSDEPIQTLIKNRPTTSMQQLKRFNEHRFDITILDTKANNNNDIISITVSPQSKNTQYILNTIATPVIYSDLNQQDRSLKTAASVQNLTNHINIQQAKENNSSSFELETSKNGLREPRIQQSDEVYTGRNEKSISFENKAGVKANKNNIKKTQMLLNGQQKINSPFKYNQGLLRRKKEARSLKLLQKSVGQQDQQIEKTNQNNIYQQSQDLISLPRASELSFQTKYKTTSNGTMFNSRSGSLKPSNIVFRGQSNIMQQHFGIHRLKINKNLNQEEKIFMSEQNQVKSPKVVTNLILNDKINQIQILAKLQDLREQQEQLQRQLASGKMFLDQSSSDTMNQQQTLTSKTNDSEENEILIQNQQFKNTYRN